MSDGYLTAGKYLKTLSAGAWAAVTAAAPAPDRRLPSPVALITPGSAAVTGHWHRQTWVVRRITPGSAAVTAGIVARHRQAVTAEAAHWAAVLSRRCQSD